MSSADDPAAGAPLVIGVGHAERQDDGVGPYVAQSLRRLGQRAVAHGGDGTGLLDLWEDEEACIVVDAVSGPGEPGTVMLFRDPHDAGFAQARFVHSTHRLGVPEAVALGRRLGRLPARLLVIGITGQAFGFGSTLSPPVAAAADRLIAELAAGSDVFSSAFVAVVSSD